jgi:hypothetical protein
MAGFDADTKVDTPELLNTDLLAFDAPAPVNAELGPGGVPKTEAEFVLEIPPPKTP